MALLANVILVTLSLLMGIRLLRQYRLRPRQHSLWYAVGLMLTAVAAIPELYFETMGALPTVLWWLYWSAASTTVGFLAVGTAFLIGPRAGKGALLATCLLTAAVVIATLLTAGPAPASFAVSHLHKAPTGAVKLPFVLQSALGSLVIFGGAAWSWWRNRGWYNVWIALGTLIFAAGGASAGLLKYSQIFYFTQTGGIVLLYLGVSMSTRPRARAALPAAQS